jgi:hypothetical protein
VRYIVVWEECADNGEEVFLDILSDRSVEIVCVHASRHSAHPAAAYGHM